MTASSRRRRTAWWLVAAATAGACLIWGLWVLPTAASVADAEPVALGTSVTFESQDGTGVWATGAAAWFGLIDCEAETADGHALAVRDVPSPGWDDTLWWMTPRRSFVPLKSLESVDGASTRVRCASTVEHYDGEYLIAADVSGGGSFGLGRAGNIDYPVGTLLALGAVTLPLLVVLLPIVLGVQAIRTRRARGLRRGA